MPSISIADLANAKLDVDHIAAVATSLGPTATDRLGNTKATLQGAMDALKTFNNRGAWAAVTAYALKDLVTSGGTWYICVAAHLSSPAFATDSAAKWRVHQGVTDAELAAELDALSVADYTALRAYAGPRKSVYVTGYLATAVPSGIAGPFTLDAHDTTSTDNGGSCIVDGLGRRWKRAYSGNLMDAWFGVAGDGLADDTTTFNAARAASRAAGAPLRIVGTPLIKAALTIDAKEYWIFDGMVGNSSGSRPSAYLVKHSSVAGDLVTFTAPNTRIDGGGILGQAGNSGDGFVIKANGVTLNYPYVEGMGRDGIRVGQAAGGINANSFLMTRPTCSINGRYGIHLSDGALGIPSNANSGTIINPLVQSNGSHGLYVNNSSWVTIINPLAEANIGFGIYLDALSNVTIIGGDTENNPGGNFFQVNPQSNKILGLDVNGFPYTSLLDYAPIAPAISGKQMVLNPGFADATIWKMGGTASIATGALSIPASSSAGQKITTVKGNSYTLQVNVSVAASRGVIQVGSTGSGTSNIVNAGYITTAGSFEYTFVALSENTWIQLLNDVASSATWQINTVTVIGNITAAGGITSSKPTGPGVGYATGAGGTVAQGAGRTTGVTINKLAGAITTDTASLAAEAAATFRVTNSTVTATDVPVVAIKGGTNSGNTSVQVIAVGAGFFDIRVSNNNAAAGAAETGAIVLNFAILKAVAA